MKFFENLFGSKKKTVLSKIEELSIPIIIRTYRQLAIDKKSLLTSKTSNEKIIEIYKEVGQAFNSIAFKRKEHIKAGNLNYIILKHLDVYESFGNQKYKQHLHNELVIYANNGLKSSYIQNAINLSLNEHTANETKTVYNGPKEKTNTFELEEFLYLANKMVINNKASNDNVSLNAFLKTKTEEDLIIIKEEIKYLMFCLLHFYVFKDVFLTTKLLNVENTENVKYYDKTNLVALERSFLASLNDFNYNIAKYQCRYSQYTYYLSKYNYSDFERAFVECFASILLNYFDNNSFSVEVNAPVQELMQVAKWVFNTYGEIANRNIETTQFIL